MRPEITVANVRLGQVPRVVGTIISEEYLRKAAAGPLSCHLVELRGDGMQQADWFTAGRRIETAGTPAFLTLRLAAEGGGWSRNDEERRPFLSRALDELSGIDVELRSPLARELGEQARAKGKLCIISFHDFQKTPSLEQLEEIIREGQEIGSVVKIAAMINSAEDIAILRKALGKPWKTPICLLGMGPLGRETRLRFPLEGSCLTYGYLDSAGAPGQYSAAELMDFYKTQTIAA